MKSCRVDIVPLIPGACVVGNTGLGVLGSDVPLTGPDGPPFGLRDIEVGDANAEVRWLILTRPTVGNLRVSEDSSFTYSGTDVVGTQHFYVEAFRSGKDMGPKLVAINVGAPYTPPTLELNLT